ncbi:MAG: bifunctional alpha/beta hydrolase/OsmC family protein [Pseudomonadota bacterium]
MAETKTQKVTFKGSQDAELAARLDLPAGPPRAYALFAHCFTCSKDILAAKSIAAGLTANGIAVLRFDFTGLGSSEGEFANTNFSSNVGDLVRAVDFLRQTYRAPSILIGHSLGGAAVLAAAPDIAEVKAVATIGAPADADHVVHNFGAKLDEIADRGEAEVSLAGRNFTIRKQFLDDLATQTVRDRVAAMKKALMVLHAPFDNTVGIDNAGAIFTAAKHPKSFISLDNADHLLSDKADAHYAANVIAAWASRYIDTDTDKAVSTGGEVPEGVVRVTETGAGTFQNSIVSGRHHLLADEPRDVGGLDTGPSPYDYLSVALGACTTMTLRLYANHKKLPVTGISVDVMHGKVHAADCTDCADEIRERNGKVDRFERVIAIEGDIEPDVRARMLEIADRCPVHRTLEAGAAVVTRGRT